MKTYFLEVYTRKQGILTCIIRSDKPVSEVRSILTGIGGEIIDLYECAANDSPVHSIRAVSRKIITG